MTAIIMRPLEWKEKPPTIPYIPGVQSYGGGCEHWHRTDVPRFPCGNSAQYMLGDERLCWSHAASRIRQLMFQRVPIEVRTRRSA